MENLSLDFLSLGILVLEELFIDALLDFLGDLDSMALRDRHLSLSHRVKDLAGFRGSGFDKASFFFAIDDLGLEVGEGFAETFILDLLWDVLNVPVAQQVFLLEIPFLRKPNNSADAVINLLQLSLEVLSLVINNANSINKQP